MRASLEDLNAFVAVAQARGFRDAARAAGTSASTLSEAVRRLESGLGVRLLHRTTRSVTPTEAGSLLLARLAPALDEVAAALDDVHGLGDRPAGTLRLNVPVSAARLVLPAILPGFMAAYPDVRLEVTAETSLVDIVARGFDAGVRWGESLAQDMVAVPLGPPQRFVVVAAPALIARVGAPNHPSDLLHRPCLRVRFASGAEPAWEFERDGEILHVDPSGPLLVQPGGAIDLAIRAAIDGVGIVYIFEAWLRPFLDSGALEPVLEAWWPAFSGPFLYYPGRRLVPAPLRAFIDFNKVPIVGP